MLGERKLQLRHSLQKSRVHGGIGGDIEQKAEFPPLFAEFEISGGVKVLSSLVDAGGKVDDSAQSGG